MESASGSTYDDTPLTNRVTTLEATVNAPITTLYIGANSPQDAYVDADIGWSASDGQNAGSVVIEASGDGYGDSAAIIVKGLEDGNTSIDLDADTTTVTGDLIVNGYITTNLDEASISLGSDAEVTSDGRVILNGEEGVFIGNPHEELKEVATKDDVEALDEKRKQNLRWIDDNSEAIANNSARTDGVNGCLLYTSPSPRDS